MSAQIVLPRILQIGENASDEIARVLAIIDCERPLIITDSMMVQLNYVARIQNNLQQSGIESEVYSDTVPEPTVASIQGGLDMVKQASYDCLIAIGGGSPIDSAKAIAILAKHGGEIADYKVPRVVDESGLPIIAIPTTAGTGSELPMK